MRRCRTCVMPDSRPDVYFDSTGECAACINFARRPNTDWEARRQELVDLLDRHHGECIVPSSGGKDSTYIAIKLLELGANVTVVTARTCHLTEIGRRNIDNLARYARTIEVVPNMIVRAKLNRLGLEMVGDCSWPEHVAIFTTPWNVAADIGVNLLMYGENPQDQYGGPQGSEQARQMTQRWRSEYGGFLGLRPSDMATMTSERSMRDYEFTPKAVERMNGGKIEAHFLGAYLPWDSHQNAAVAEAFGMQYQLPISSNWWAWENQDNGQCGAGHDLFGYLKYGYTRGQAQISVDIRSGRVTRSKAMAWLRAHPQAFPHQYAGVPLNSMLERLGTDREWFDSQIKTWTNADLFDTSNNDSEGLPRLKEVE